jgi:type I restriction enzyme S subunit
MSAEWHEYPLGELCKEVTVGFVGSMTKEYRESGIPFFRSKNIGEYTIDWSDMRYVSQDFHQKLKKSALKPGDVAVVRTGKPGTACVIPDDIEEANCSDIVIIRVDPDRLSAHYLSYFMNSVANHQINSHLVGAVQQHFNVGAAKKIIIKAPCVTGQEQIVKVLKDLDDKIQINHQINQTLEQMAQTIFKSWFVDFEPVKAKIAARERWHALQPDNEAASPVCYAGELEAQPFDVDLETYMNLAAMQAISGSSLYDADASAAGAADQLSRMQAEQPELYAELRATAELFPSAMQDSELGGIPEGWEVSQIGNEVTVVGGGTPSTKTPEFWDEGNIHWTTPKDLSNLSDKVLLDTERKITAAGLVKISSGLLPVDTVLMSSRAPVGYLALAKTPVAVNQGYIAMKCERRLSPEFVIQWCEANMNEIKGRASGTTFAEISKKNFKVIPVITPPANTVSAYSQRVKPLYSAIESQSRESLTLAQFRDALLPKLLSGELTLADTEAPQPELQDVAHV